MLFESSFLVIGKDFFMDRNKKGLFLESFLFVGSDGFEPPKAKAS